MCYRPINWFPKRSLEYDVPVHSSEVFVVTMPRQGLSIKSDKRPWLARTCVLYVLYSVSCDLKLDILHLFFSLLADLARKISAVSGDDRDSTFLFHSISVLIQRHNCILLRQSFRDETRPDDDI